MHTSFALMLTTSLPFAGSAAAKDLWPKAASSAVNSGEDWTSFPAPEPVPDMMPAAIFVPDTVAA